MAGFTENALVRKLQELNSSQQSIQTLSLWLIHHRKHHSAVVKTWFKEFMKVKDGRQLTFMYLANDVIQNSKKKGPEYGQEFGEVLGESFKHMAKTGVNTKTKHSLHRILNIWQERGVYDAQKIQDFKVCVDPNDAIPEENNDKSGIKRKSAVVPESKDPDTRESEKKKKKSESKHERRQSETKIEVDGTIETHTTLSPKTPPGDPPESEELVKALLELELSASSDEAVRERIASLPPEVSEVALLSKLEGNEPHDPFASLRKTDGNIDYAKMEKYYRILVLLLIIFEMDDEYKWLLQKNFIPAPQWAKTECSNCAQNKAKFKNCSKL